jgi:hypothetical protein
VTRGKGVRPFGEHVDDLVPVYFAEITSMGPSRFHDGGPSQVTPGGMSGRGNLRTNGLVRPRRRIRQIRMLEWDAVQSSSDRERNSQSKCSGSIRVVLLPHGRRP